MSIVTIIVPCRNERDHIEEFLENIITQDTADYEIEVIVADGISDDGTRQILSDICTRQRNVKVIDNPKRIVSTGLNAAIHAAVGEIIVRLDVHTRYANDYIKECVRALEESGAICVGGPWIAAGHTKRQIAIADAFQSPIGSGAAVSRKVDYSGPCDTVYLGCWRRADLVEIGGFDEDLIRNQDDELNLRFSKKGGKIWQSASIKSTYFPRRSYRSLFQQFSQYGYWKVAVAKKHGQHASLRHLIPFFFVFGCASLIAGSVFSRFFSFIAILYIVTYVVTVLIAACFASSRKTIVSISLVAAAICIMHVGYGLGYALGLVDFRVRKNRRSSVMSMLTR